jgi:hypothetical protein
VLGAACILVQARPFVVLYRPALEERLVGDARSFALAQVAEPSREKLRELVRIPAVVHAQAGKLPGSEGKRLGHRPSR